MATDRIGEIENEIVVLHFVVTHLLIAHCEKQEDPVGFAQDLLAQIESLFDATQAQSDEMPAAWKAQMRERMTALFALVVSRLREKTSHHDA